MVPENPSVTHAAPPLAQISERLRLGDFDQVHERIKRVHGCACPVRLSGELRAVDAVTGDSRPVWSSKGEPGGGLWVPCGNRRATICPACADTYQGDTFQLIRSGLVGGKTVPDRVREHPRVFATFTAPSFGAVHRGPAKDGKTRVCHPRRSGTSCARYHRADDPLIGAPLDPDAYDYARQVMWNNHAGELWRRFTVYLRRHLAAAVGMTQAEFNAAVRVSYAKVAEFQARGVVHFHAVIRLDSMRKDGIICPPPTWVSVAHLDAAVASAAAAVLVTTDPVPGLLPALFLRWGIQLDTHAITTDAFTAGSLTEEAVAAYIAKYATKSTTDTGALDRRIRSLDDLDRIGVTAHQRRIIEACWTLADVLDLEERKLREWAHMLGFRGHFSTKSRRYSTTLGALRQVRRDYRAHQARQTGTDDLLGDLDDDGATTLIVGTFAFAGQGYDHSVDAWMAANHHRGRIENRQIAREESAA
ncbi:replication initiator [Actinorugispora endophytica]|uniref:Replication initiation protein n=1 Tax=Actinorugispora endophytica TaxID=1605990 RepID=A0A4R6UW86_9ACTN|nr:replication initiator [Actinorugispora endophytica]TDQ51511.1 hypothetical protein EV190_111119 [Actinorugispora endophytica]